MLVLRLSAPVLALAQLLVTDNGASAQTTNRYPSSPPYVSPYPAQPSPYTVQPVSDADMLASEIRLLAADPNNLQALLRAGELALKLDDDTAAGAFFARAGRIDPHNGRVKAGEGSLLVAAERPGEALRRFAEAQSYGVDVRSLAAERGLAYDLIGEQDRAQRDYRVALRAGANDETQRRYALSLGISGKRDLALAQIDPLLRKSDRAAWRARAFILAMSGDKAGAEKIATSMMPQGTAQGLQPFFEILPKLPRADRAFAVHFGEVRATPERLADARLVPPLATLAADPTAPVEVAAVVAEPVTAVDARKGRKSRRKRDQFAAVTTPPPPPLPGPPTFREQPVAAPVALASTNIRMPPAYTPAAARPTPARTAVATPQPVAPAFFVPRTAPAPVPALAARPVVVAPAPLIVPSINKPDTIVAPTTTSATAPPAAAPPAAVGISPPAVSAVSTSAVSPVSAGAPLSAPTPVRSEDSILAAIIADIKVPRAELHAAPTVARLPSHALPQPVLPPPLAQAHQAEIARKTDEKSVADKQALTDKKAETDKKAAADKKALADKKAAAAKKLADAKKAAEEKRKNDPKILEPSRVWVQVAGGANVHDLPKQWAKVRAQSTKAFGGKGGWTTPLRATNRLLTGPFKTEAEAQSFVNMVAKDGISGFVFVSEAGQKITKLAAK